MKRAALLRLGFGVIVLLSLTAALPAPGGAASRGARQLARRATRDYGQLLRQVFGSFHGYYTCPTGQLSGHQIFCRAEFHQGPTWFSASATADVRVNPTSFSNTSSVSWKRKWTRYSAAPLRGFNTPGKASVNTKYEDWAFLAAGAYYNWQHHKHFAVVDSYDGQGLGYERFDNFRCRIGQKMISCRNAFGDAMRYRPSG